MQTQKYKKYIIQGVFSEKNEYFYTLLKHQDKDYEYKDCKFWRNIA